MPRFIIKVAPDVDQYVEWSTVVDNIVWSGTREQLVKHGQREGWFTGSAQQADIEARIARTDEAGTSAQFFDPPAVQEGAWEDARLLVTNDEKRDGYFWLNRDDLGAYAAGDSSVLIEMEEED